MADLLFTIVLCLPFVFIIGLVVYRSQRRKWARSKADRIIAGDLESDVSYINGIIEILRPRGYFSLQHEDDRYRVEQLREIRDSQ